MRYLVILLVLIVAVTVNAQPPVKTIPGVFIYDMGAGNYKYSPAGNTIALRRGSYDFVLFDVQKGSLTQVNRNLASISSDHNYFFDNGQYRVDQNGPNNTYRWAWEIKSAAVNDTLVQKLRTNHYALDMDEKGNLIATRTWFDSSSGNIMGMKGLYRVDRRTGKELQVLRDDTLYSCKYYRNCNKPTLYLQKNYLAIGAQSYHSSIDILPFGSTEKITINAHQYHTAIADSLVVFTITDSTLYLNRVQAFDTRTGKFIASKLYDKGQSRSIRYEFLRNKMYVFRNWLGTIQEETPGKDTILTTKTWEVSNQLGLSQEQYWEFIVTKGPSFFIVPGNMKKGETGGAAANTAFMVQGSNNKTTWQVSPFYNRTADDVARMDKDAKDSKAFVDKIKREKDSIAHPERYCHLFWNTNKWRRGITIYWGAAYRIQYDYDCKKDEYILWSPGQLYNGNGHRMKPEYIRVPGIQFRGGDYSTNKAWATCTECDGDGTYQVTEYTTKTKDLPWGYFSGIETKKITTTSKVVTYTCKQCHGEGVVLK